jgi:hypothetical protein
VYVAAVVAVLAAYFTYQWWFSPQRAIKRQLGELAATLSAPADSRGDIDRLARAARLRRYFAPDVHVKTRWSNSAAAEASDNELTSRDAVIAAAAAWAPSADWWRVDFVDVQVTLDSASAARGYMTVEVTTPDPATGQPVVDAHEAIVELARRDEAWVITSAGPNEPPPRP